MAEPVLFLLLALATWRLTSLLVHEEGPFEVFVKFRHWAGVRYNIHSERYGENVVAKALCCSWCTSVWVGFCLAFLSPYNTNPVWWFISAMSLSAIAVVVDSVVMK